MGVSIDARVYDIREAEIYMREYLQKYAEFRREESMGTTPLDFIKLVGPEFGVIIGDSLVMVYNEYYEDYNPTLNFLEAVKKFYFGTDDLYSLDMSGYPFPWLDQGEDVPGGAEPMDRDRAKELGLDYPDEEYDDEDY